MSKKLSHPLHIILTFSLLIMVISNAFSQIDDRLLTYKSTNIRALKLYEKANECFRKRDLSTGISDLKKCIKRHPDFFDAYWLLIQIYEYIGYGDSIYNYVEKFSEYIPLDSIFPAHAHAVALLSYNNGKYEKAKKFISAYKQKTSDWTNNLETVRLDKSIQFSLDNKNNKVNYSTEVLPKEVNNFYSQYFPSVTADDNSIVFTAIKSENSSEVENVFISTKDENGNWIKAKSISKNINTKSNAGASAISGDGNTLIFTSCNEDKTLGSCDLMYAQKIGDEWTNIKNMGNVVNSSAWESQPNLSSDGKALYFSSNRAGGRGGKDIWVTYFNDSVWSKPENLGAVINTEYDELTPFIHFNNQKLYFASSGHLGFGGFDIFTSEKNEDGSWSSPKNFGYGINDHKDQLTLIVSSDNATGYYGFEETNAKGKLVSKLAKVTFEIEKEKDSVETPKDTIISQPVTYLVVVGKIIDKKTKAPLSAKIRLYPTDSASQIFELVSDSINGNFNIELKANKEYHILVEKTNYNSQKIQFLLEKDTSLENYIIEVALNKIAEEVEEEEIVPVEDTVVVEKVEEVKDIESKNIFFKINSYSIDKTYFAILDEIKDFIIKKGVKVEISGHCDKTGPKEFNDILSEKRAKSIYDYFINNGVKADLLNYVGYSWSNPKFLNQSEEYKNRRVEFKILSE